MSKNITIIGKFLIEDGKSEEVKKLIPKVTEFGKANGLLVDEYYISDDKTNGIHMTRYEDSDKLKEHLTKLFAELERFEEIQAIIKENGGEIYGGPIADDV